MGDNLIKKGLAIGIILVFIASTITPIVISYGDEDTEEDEYLENLAFFCYDKYNSATKLNYYKELFQRDSIDSVISDDVSQPIELPPDTISSDGPMDSAWPMFGYDIRNTGRSPYSTEETTGIEKWRFDMEWPLWYSSPVIGEDNMIYIGGADLYGIYPNGTMKWKYDTTFNIQSTPTLDENGIIYAATSHAHTNLLYAIYTDNGTLKWINEIGDDAFCSPAIDPNGTIYCSGGYNMYAIYPNNGTRKWRFHTNHYIYSSPAIDDDSIYFGSHDKNVYALWKNNGTLKWTFETGAWVHGSPSIADDGTVYIGSDDGFLYALYPNNGTMKWKTGIGSGMRGAPAIDSEGSLYFGTSNEKFMGVYRDGTIKWVFDLGDMNGVWGSSAAISADGTIYFGTCIRISHPDGGEIIALGLDGVEKWRKQIATGFVRSSPAIGADGMVYIGSTNKHSTPGGEGYFHAFGPIESNVPPNTPTIDGPLEGKVGEKYTYEFSTNDPDNNPIAYFVDWGDGTNTGWTMDFEQGIEIPLEHEWNRQDTYTIKVKARDTLGEESNWAYLEVEMPVSQHPFYSLFLRFLDRFPNAFPMLRSLLGISH